MILVTYSKERLCAKCACYARRGTEVGRAASRGFRTLNISKRKQASPGICALIITFYFAWCYYLAIGISIQVSKRTVRDGLWRSHPLATKPVYFANFCKKGPARKGVPIEILPRSSSRILKRDCVRSLACCALVETVSAELPRVADGEMASGDEYCGTKLLTFKDLRDEVCLNVCVKSLR